MTRPLRLCAVLIGLATAMVACGEDPLAPAEPRLITVVPDTLRLPVGETDRFAVTITDTAGAPLDSVPVVWISGDPTVAAVDDSGRVTGVGLGRTTVTVESQGFAAEAIVEVGLAFSQISAGEAHTCGIAPGGTAWCWGDGSRGQLGQGSTTGSTTPVKVAGGLRWTSLSAGGFHTCGLAQDGRVRCWGDGAKGQLGKGSTGQETAPVPITSPAVFRAVAAGREHTCGLTADDRTLCWGSNATGQLGDGGSANRLMPSLVAGGRVFATISAGRNHTCATTAAGVGYCWGSNSQGQLGTASITAPQLTPVRVASPLGYTRIAAGDGTFSCGVDQAGLVRCWGRGDAGQLGTGAMTALDSLPPAVASSTPFTVLAAGTFHVCGVGLDGAPSCWGTGRLGLPGVTQSDVPVEIPLTLAGITAGRFHTCGWTWTGRAFCWGGNDAGQLGTGTTIPSETPLPVALQIPAPAAGRSGAW